MQSYDNNPYDKWALDTILNLSKKWWETQSWDSFIKENILVSPEDDKENSEIWKWIFNSINLSKIYNVLDVGCSWGHTCFNLYTKFKSWDIVGIDISNLLVGVAKGLKSYIGEPNNIVFFQSDIHDQIFTDNKFDLVCVHSSFEHFIDPRRCLYNIRKINNNIMIGIVPMGNAYDNPSHLHHFDNENDLINFLSSEYNTIDIKLFNDRLAFICK